MIDPVPVSEALARIKTEKTLLDKRANGARALGWFSDHALSRTGGGVRCTLQGVLPPTIHVVASGTPDADTVKPYLTRAFREHHRRILERAIELAREDFEAEQ